MDRTRSMLHSSIIGESSDDSSGSCVVFISTDTEENTIENVVTNVTGTNIARDQSPSVNNDLDNMEKDSSKYVVDDTKEGCSKDSKPMRTSNIDSDDFEVFEQRYKHDLNFVHAKFAVKKRIDLKSERKLEGFQRKFRQTLLQADILIIKRKLDAAKSVPIQEIVSLEETFQSKPENSTAYKLEAPNLEKDVTSNTDMKSQMPLVVSNHSKEVEKCGKMEINNVPPDDGSKVTVSVEATTKLPEKVARKKIPLPARGEGRSIVPPPPALSFLTTNMKSFKIPRTAKKANLSLKERVGAMWMEAQTTDLTGQWYYVDGRSKSIKTSIIKRELPQYETWLVTDREGDTADWSRILTPREEPRVRGKEREMVTMEESVSTIHRDERQRQWPQGDQLEEETAGDVDSFTDNSMDVSGQSVVTHIQSPTYTMLDQLVELEETKAVKTDVEGSLSQTQSTMCEDNLTPTESVTSSRDISKPGIFNLPTQPSNYPSISTVSHSITDTSSCLRSSIAGVVSKKRVRLKLDL